jgi:hypothetical protein
MDSHEQRTKARPTRITAPTRSAKCELAFNAALCDMQVELPVMEKRGAIIIDQQLVGYYAKFEDINEAVKPILQRHGFAVSFRMDTANGVVKVTGILAHKRGHRESTEITLPVDLTGKKNPVQAVGSSVSYGKRYVLEALLNLTSRGQDDDARATEDPTVEPDSTGKALLEACDTVFALQAAWKRLTVEQRKSLGDIKTACKQAIEAREVQS